MLTGRMSCFPFFFNVLQPRVLGAWQSTYLILRACLHGGVGPQVGEITCLGGVTRLSIYSHFIFIAFSWWGGVTIWEIIWTCGLPHPTGLPHLPGAPYLLVNRSIGMHFRGFISFWQRNDRKTCRRRRVCCRCCWLLLGSAFSSSSLTFLGNCSTL